MWNGNNILLDVVKAPRILSTKQSIQNYENICEYIQFGIIQSAKNH